MISLLKKWLPAFVVEARREDGKRYPAPTINQLLAGLWRAVRIICLGLPTRVIWLISLGDISHIAQLSCYMIYPTVGAFHLMASHVTIYNYHHSTKLYRKISRVIVKSMQHE